MRDFDPTASEFISSGYLASSRPGGRLYDPATIIGAGATLVGGMMSSDASEDAADTQAQSAREATELQREMFNKQIELQEPFRQAGGLGLNRILYELGISPTGTFNAQTSAMETADQIRARLAPQFPGATAPASTSLAPGGGYGYDAGTGIWWGGTAEGPAAPTQTANAAQLEAAVQAEIQRQRAAQQAQTTAQTAAAQKDPNYGNLLRNFTMQDFQTDPGYGFRQSEGEKVLQRAASAQGGIGSGRFLKDAMRFNQGLASDEFSRAYDRFGLNRDSRFNKLASIAGVGQTATNQTANAAQNFGTAAAGNIMGAGNALAAGRVGGANAWNNAIGQGTSMYQTNRLLDKYMPSTVPRSPFDISGGFGGGSFGAFNTAPGDRLF